MYKRQILDCIAAALAVGISSVEIRAKLVDDLIRRSLSPHRMVDGAEGLIALAEGRPAEAAPLLGRALVDARPNIARPIEGSLHLAHAQALLASGDRDGATAAARRAVDALKHWPGWRRDRADAMVARLEGSAMRAVGELTARESEVAGLIAEGLTNGQLAERLFISPKTAAVHVSNILAKLALTSRAEIAAWAVRQDLPIAG